MTETTTYLSPNGQDTRRGDGPATRILVATVEGASWTCVVDNVAPVSKDHHHIAFLPPEQAEMALAAPRLAFRSLEPMPVRRRCDG